MTDTVTVVATLGLVTVAVLGYTARAIHADRPADVDDTNVLGERPDGYVGKRRAGVDAHWRAAHTRRASHAQHALRDDGSGGWRVDLIVDETREISSDQITRALADAEAGTR